MAELTAKADDCQAILRQVSGPVRSGEMRIVQSTTLSLNRLRLFCGVSTQRCDCKAQMMHGMEGQVRSEYDACHGRHGICEKACHWKLLVLACFARHRVSKTSYGLWDLYRDVDSHHSRR